MYLIIQMDQLEVVTRLQRLKNQTCGAAKMFVDLFQAKDINEEPSKSAQGGKEYSTNFKDSIINLTVELQLTY